LDQNHQSDANYNNNFKLIILKKSTDHYALQEFNFYDCKYQYQPFLNQYGSPQQ